jgi:hypothetical protein
MVTTSSLIADLVQARDRGAAWLLDHQREDGAIGDPARDGLGPYYKALWAFAASGRPDAANRLASWVQANLLQEDGDFAGPLRTKLHDRVYSYPNAWLIGGAQKAGRFDLAMRGMDFLLLLQNGEDGGFRTQRDREDSAQDLLCSAQCGNACLLTGHVSEARNVGRFLRTVWHAQPDPERELFFAYRPGEGLRTDFPDERQRLYSVRADQPRQMYFQPGIAAAFLARLAMATGDREWSALGRRYLEIAFHVLDEMYETAQVGKVGWGAALLYAVTREEACHELAARVGRAMLDQQTPEGAWDNTGGYVDDVVRAECTAEFVVLLDEMAGGLAA